MIKLFKIFVILTIIFTLSAVVAAFLFGMDGTIQSSPTVASSSGVVTTNTHPPTTSTASTDTAQFSQVTHISASTIQAHWGSGADYDGIIVHADLRDNSDTTIKWSGATLPVDIQIYTTKFDSNYKQIKDQLVFQGTGQITSWMDGNMFMDGGIRVPYSSMHVPTGEQYGWTIVRIAFIPLDWQLCI